MVILDIRLTSDNLCATIIMTIWKLGHQTDNLCVTMWTLHTYTGDLIFKEAKTYQEESIHEKVNREDIAVRKSSPAPDKKRVKGG